MTPYVARANPRSIMSFLALRTHDETANHVSFPQWEIEVVARKIEGFFAHYYPLTYAAFIEFGREAP
jgi:thymidylate synthase (FAD)